MPKKPYLKKILIIGSGPYRHRTGCGVRLRGDSGLQSYQGRRDRDYTGQQQSRNHHDRQGDS